MKQCDIKVRKRHNKESTREDMKKILKVAPLGDHNELVVCEILTRLPAKSLMRFKCVCKSWQSLIRKDQHFIDLHFNRSQKRSRSGTVGALLMWMPYTQECFLWGELLIPYEGGHSGGAALQRRISVPWPGSGNAYMLNIVNGLICFVHRDKYFVCVYNPSTRESTLWEGDHRKYEGAKCWHMFGYDLATKDYKVVWFWSYRDKRDTVCEIFSLRNKSWRLVDVVPPDVIYQLRPVYVNGSIYWLCTDGRSIVEFNLASEKFRLITAPSSITIRFSGHYETVLKVLDGRLALLAEENIRPTKATKKHGDIVPTSLKMCILYEDQDEVKHTSTAGRTTDYAWIEETIAMPPRCDWRPELVGVTPIPGTDLLVVRSKKELSFYYYNWKNKSYSRKFELEGTESFFDFKNGGFGDFYTYTENLMPLK